MAPVYKIALIQFQPKPIHVAANYAYAAEAIREAAAAGAHLAVLPEYHLTSWVPEQPEFVAACAASGAYLERYRALARELRICLVPGTIVEAHTRTQDPGQDGTLTTVLDGRPVDLRNMAYFIDGDGNVSGSYQKINLWHTERAHLVAPTRAAAKAPDSTMDWPPHRAFDLPWPGHARPDNKPLRAGLLVCWDLAFPEAFRALVADGADLIIIPSFWSATDVDAAALARNPDCEMTFIQATTVARAFENTCAVAFCNAGGATLLAQPIVGAQGMLAPGEARTSFVEFDAELVALADQNYKIKADMARANWHYADTVQWRWKA